MSKPTAGAMRAAKLLSGPIRIPGAEQATYLQYPEAWLAAAQCIIDRATGLPELLEAMDLALAFIDTVPQAQVAYGAGEQSYHSGLVRRLRAAIAKCEAGK